MSSSGDPNRLTRRGFVRLAGVGTAGLFSAPPGSAEARETEAIERALRRDRGRPTLRYYPPDRLARIALPVGGLGTGTLSLGGRGDLRDWEIMNRPAKGYVPSGGGASPFFALRAQPARGATVCRVLEGPIEAERYEGSHGSPAAHAGLPRFERAAFATAYPFGRVLLEDPAVPLGVELEAFNPLVPADVEASSLPVAVFTITLVNPGDAPVAATVCATLPNTIGIDGWETEVDWKGDHVPKGASRNRNAFRAAAGCQGLFLDSAGVDPEAPTWGSLALVTDPEAEVSHRTSWAPPRWGDAVLDFWEDLEADGRLGERPAVDDLDTPVGSLAVTRSIPPGERREVVFLLAWHFPNRLSWTPEGTDDDRIGNHYATLYEDAWAVAERTLPRLPELRERTTRFVSTLCESDLPDAFMEAALFNVSTLRTQTCFRTPDGRFFGFEGSGERKGCCHGSCTHVWNYEQTTPFLFGELASSMREVEFGHATGEDGLMSFRVHLPLSRSRAFGKAAADGQMGCLLKMHRDWQLSGDDALLRRLWPAIRRSLEFAWIPGGWDADRDGVMEGCQHNTMDVEYFGPNPEMAFWYLGALRAASEMARAVGDDGFAESCAALFERGSAWIDAHLFNGRYYVQRVEIPRDPAAIPDGLRVGMGASDVTRPDYQLGGGCLVDQVVGQLAAHVCGLGHLADPAKIRRSLHSVWAFSSRGRLDAHVNPMRAFALDGEPALLMTSYPDERPERPFPYYAEAWTGLEYTAAAGMLFEGMEKEAVECVRRVRSRYDGLRRNPFDEAECGHHYVRAMAAWALVLAWTGFGYSAVTSTLTLGSRAGRFFWSNGYAWGGYVIEGGADERRVALDVVEGRIEVARVVLAGWGEAHLGSPRGLAPGAGLDLVVSRTTDG